MNRILKMMTWNANGLLKHKDELQVILNITEIDICLISETHFTKQSFLRVKGYNIYHAIHPSNTARGGSAIIVKENIKHIEIEKFSTEEIQATVIKVETPTNSLIVAGIYSPPRHSIKNEFYSRFLQKLGDRFIVGGDFNAKNTFWGSRLTTTKGRELLTAINENYCDVFSSGSPTYWPSDPRKKPDLIDFFVAKNISRNYINIENSQYMNSDHSPVILTYSQNICMKQSPATLTNSRTNWKEFKAGLERKMDLSVPLKTTAQLDTEVENL